MERKEGAVLQDDNGAGTEGAVQANAPDATPATQSQLPPELQPDKDGNPPQLTEQLLRKLRGKYFTVRHPLLTNCGHKLDMVNQPKNNCENCWFQWFNTHPQLIETADQFFRTHGKAPLIGMRGEKFFKMFVRYMATIIHFMNEEKALKAAQEKQNAAVGTGSETVPQESRTDEAESPRALPAELETNQG